MLRTCAPRTHSPARLPWALVATVSITGVTPGLARAQRGAGDAASDTDGSSTIHACYVPESGTIYRIDAPGARHGCAAPSHVAFSWAGGAARVGHSARSEDLPTDGRPGIGASGIATSRFAYVAFQHVAISPMGAPPIVVATLTFTAPSTGVAVLLGRGHCNMLPAWQQDNRINLVAAPAGTAPFDISTLPEWGVLNVPMGSVYSTPHVPNFTSRTVLPVTQGVAYTVSLYGRHEIGYVNASDCTGTFTATLR